MNLQLTSLHDNAPTVALILWAIVLGVGLVLWLFGGRLVRPLFALTGLTLGAMAGFGISQTFAPSQWVIVWVGAGAVVGYLLSWLMFRLWAGLSLAVLLATVIPVTSILWQNQPLPEVVSTKSVDKQVPINFNESGPKLDLTVPMEQIESLTDEQMDRISHWWSEQSSTSRQFIYGCAIIGAIAGLIGGLLLPNIAAAFESSLAGALLITLAGHQLALSLMPDPPAWLSTSTRAMLITAGLITILGLMLQWTILRRRTDK